MPGDNHHYIYSYVVSDELEFKSTKSSEVTVTPVDYSSITQLILPANLEMIETESFNGIPAKVVVIPDGCKTIASKAFSQCANLKYVVLSDDTDIEIASDAFPGSVIYIRK